MFIVPAANGSLSSDLFFSSITCSLHLCKFQIGIQIRIFIYYTSNSSSKRSLKEITATRGREMVEGNGEDEAVTGQNTN